MIKSKNELRFYKMADCMMNRGYFKPNFVRRFINFFSPDYIMLFLRYLRNSEFYMGGGVKGILSKAMLQKYSLKLGFSIAPNVFGYGLVIPHYGTIVVGSGNKIGNYAVLHTMTCITSGKKTIGDGLYLSVGSIILKDVQLDDNVTIAANSVINCNIDRSNSLVTGIPTRIIRESLPWFIRDGNEYNRRHDSIESLKRKMNI